jgi:hypothetical protein
MKNKSTTVAFRVTDEVMAKLDSHAKQERRTRANVLTLIVEDYYNAIDFNSLPHLDPGSSNHHERPAGDGPVVHEEVGE